MVSGVGAATELSTNNGPFSDGLVRIGSAFTVKVIVWGFPSSFSKYSERISVKRFCSISTIMREGALIKTTESSTERSEVFLNSVKKFARETVFSISRSIFFQSFSCRVFIASRGWESVSCSVLMWITFCQYPNVLAIGFSSNSISAIICLYGKTH